MDARARGGIDARFRFRQEPSSPDLRSAKTHPPSRIPGSRLGGLAPGRKIISGPARRRGIPPSGSGSGSPGRGSFPPPAVFSTCGRRFPEPSPAGRPGRSCRRGSHTPPRPGAAGPGASSLRTRKRPRGPPPLEDRPLREGLARLEDVKYLLLPVLGELEELHAPRYDDEKTVGAIPLPEDRGPSRAMAHGGYPGDAVQVPGGKVGKHRRLPQHLERGGNHGLILPYFPCRSRTETLCRTGGRTMAKVGFVGLGALTDQ